MLNICSMDYDNHEKVALAGIIPCLVWFIENGAVHFLKELSLKLFLAMPHSSGASPPPLLSLIFPYMLIYAVLLVRLVIGHVRELLWECNAFPVYMRLLQDGFWYVDVLQCLLKWRRLDPTKIDAEMEKRAKFLVFVFSFCGKPGFQKALEPLLDLVQVHNPSLPSGSLF